MPTGLERPGGTSSGLPPALLKRNRTEADISCPRRGWAPSVRFCLQSPGDDRAPCGARRRTRICTTWTLNPSPPFGINHLGQRREAVPCDLPEQLLAEDVALDLLADEAAEAV